MKKKAATEIKTIPINQEQSAVIAAGLVADLAHQPGSQRCAQAKCPADDAVNQAQPPRAKHIAGERRRLAAARAFAQGIHQRVYAKQPRQPAMTHQKQRRHGGDKPE